MTDYSIIEAVKTYIMTYTGFESGSQINTDYLGIEPSQYAIIPLPGPIVIEEYLESSLNEFTFALQATLSTAAEASRLGNGKFFELFRDWLKSQNLARIYPVISENKVPCDIAAINSGFIMQDGESQTSIYQITCKMQYDEYNN